MYKVHITQRTEQLHVKLACQPLGPGAGTHPQQEDQSYGKSVIDERGRTTQRNKDHFAQQEAIGGLLKINMVK